MSSPGSAVTVELPRWLLADRLSVVLASSTAPVVELVLARHPGAPAGVGVVVAALLLAGLWWQRRRRPRALQLANAGGWMQFADGARLGCQPGPGSRLLGSSVVLHWQAAARTGALWLTPADLPRQTLRALAVRLVAGR
jgi:hypothetical protein